MAGMRRALLVGASGFLGARLNALLGDRCVPTYRTRPVAGGVAFDAASDRLATLLPRLPSDLTHVIAPFGVIDMEGCARDPAGTAATNVVAVTRVLKDAIDAGLHPLFISTDYVFGGERALWTERDEAYPRMAYGAQKLAVERWLQTIEAPWTVIRLSKIVSGDTTTHSMLGQWLVELKQGRPQRCAADQRFSPAFVDDLVDAIIQLGDIGATGLFHAAGPESISRIELLRMLAAEIRDYRPDFTAEISPCSLHDLPFLEKRPLDTSLSVEKLRDTISYDFIDMRTLCRRIAQSSEKT